MCLLMPGRALPIHDRLYTNHAEELMKLKHKLFFVSYQIIIQSSAIQNFVLKAEILNLEGYPRF